MYPDIVAYLIHGDGQKLQKSCKLLSLNKPQASIIIYNPMILYHETAFMILTLRLVNMDGLLVIDACEHGF